MKSFCEKCWKGYNSDFSKHKCNNVCGTCKSRHCYESERETDVICQNCNSRCHNLNCLENHRIKCRFGKTCAKCNLVMGKYHRCVGRYCMNCKRMVEEKNHQCYIKTEKQRDDAKIGKGSNVRQQRGYIFFDYECMTEDFHEPNLIIADQICMPCLNDDGINCGGTCGIHTFKTNSTFCRWLLINTRKYLLISRVYY